MADYDTVNTPWVKDAMTPRMCGYSNCFRDFYRMRGFMPVCRVHMAEPQKRPGNGSVFVQVKE